MENSIFSRKEVYEMVWSKPLKTIAVQFGITLDFIKKVCKEMQIPLPVNGYWSRMRYGKSVFIEPLPEDYSGKQKVDLSQKSDPDEEIISVLPPLLVLQKQIESDKRLRLKVPHNLSNPDPLIVSAKKSMQKGHNSSRLKGGVTCELDHLNIAVSSGKVGRALRVMNTLIKALKARGHSITNHYKTTNVIVFGEEVEIALREQGKRIIVKGTYWDSSEYHPNGQLYIKIDRPYRCIAYKDGKLKLEDQLSRIIARIEIIGKKEHETRLRRIKEAEEKKERERIRKEYEEQQDRELEDFKELLAKSKRWLEAENLRNFIDAIEQKAVKKGSVTNDLANWLDWARKKADWFDPFMEAFDGLLYDANRESLSFNRNNQWKKGRGIK